MRNVLVFCIVSAALVTDPRAQDLTAFGPARQLLEAGKLIAPIEPGALFGVAMALSDDLLVIGASEEDSGRGAAYIFRRPAGGWSSEHAIAILTPTDGLPGDHFGGSGGGPWRHHRHRLGGRRHPGHRQRRSDLRVREARLGLDQHDGNRQAHRVGRAGVQQPRHQRGRRRRHHPRGRTWRADTGRRVARRRLRVRQAHGRMGEQHRDAKLTPTPLPSIFLGLGRSLAVSSDGQTLVAGTGSFPPSSGGAYVFEKPAGGWTDGNQVAILTGDPTAVPAAAVAVEGDTVVFSSPTGIAGGVQTGAAYVFDKPATGWVDAQATIALSPSDGITTIGRFGDALSFDGKTVAVGWPFSVLPTAGAVYLYDKPSSGWTSATETAKLQASDTAAGDTFGGAVVLADGQLFVGAAVAVITTGAGATYVYDSPTVTSAGCGVPAPAVSGSRRLGGQLELRFPPCTATRPTFVVGTPRAQPVALPVAGPCGNGHSCQLTCYPTLVVSGPTATVTLESDPALLGVTLCVQGICLAEQCTLVTDRAELIVSR